MKRHLRTHAGKAVAEALEPRQLMAATPLAAAGAARGVVGPPVARSIPHVQQPATTTIKLRLPSTARQEEAPSNLVPGSPNLTPPSGTIVIANGGSIDLNGMAVNPSSGGLTFRSSGYSSQITFELIDPPSTGYGTLTGSGQLRLASPYSSNSSGTLTVVHQFESAEQMRVQLSGNSDSLVIVSGGNNPGGALISWHGYGFLNGTYSTYQYLLGLTVNGQIASNGGITPILTVTPPASTEPVSSALIPTILTNATMGGILVAPQLVLPEFSAE